MWNALATGMISCTWYRWFGVLQMIALAHFVQFNFGINSTHFDVVWAHDIFYWIEPCLSFSANWPKFEMKFESIEPNKFRCYGYEETRKRNANKRTLHSVITQIRLLLFIMIRFAFSFLELSNVGCWIVWQDSSCYHHFIRLLCI